MTMTADTVMHFGKHKGKALKDIPTDYLIELWMAPKKYGVSGDLMKYITNNLIPEDWK